MVRTSGSTDAKNIFLRMLPVQRFVISVLLAIITYLLLLMTDLEVVLKIMIAWSAFALSYIITSCIVFFTQNSMDIRKHAKQEDGSRIYVFLLIVITSFASLFTVLLLMLSQSSKDTPQMIFIPVAICGMLFSWLMVHTIFAFHYAHLYYGDDSSDSSKHAEGLEFPGEKKPDYVDFVYFSFVIGTTFQVSDTNITSRSIRRLVLLHGLLSFGLNTFVVALTINLIAGLMK
jgi:uncharacterized membrane protein